MTKHTVAKPFNTPSRRFRVGQEVSELDITGPLSFAERVALGQIAAPKPAKAAKGEKATPETDPTV